MTIRAKTQTSKYLLFLPIPLTLLSLFTLPHLFPTLSQPAPAATALTPPPRGNISPLFHSQNLSHGAFHNDYTKPYLADLVSRHHPHPRSAVIIGLAWGSEANLLKGYDVHAIEPMPHFVEAFRKRGAAHVTIYPYAAADEQGVMEVTYQDRTVRVNKTRGDAVLPDMAPVLVSADTQGSEYYALQGLGKILESAGSVWVELGCRDSTEEMLRWLDERFVLFDFVPWGKSRSEDDDDEFSESSFATGERPDGIGEWVEWFCAQRKKFRWLQTDVVGVRREIVGELWNGLENVGKECCKAGCRLRDLNARV